MASSAIGYLSLDPRLEPPLDRLYEMAEDWQIKNQSSIFTKASLHVEIGLREQPYSQAALRQFDEAEDLLSHLGHDCWVRKGEVLKAYLPTFRQRSDRVSRHCAEKLLEFVEQDVSSAKTDHRSDLGRAMEIYTLLLLRKGHIVGRPSFTRQEMGLTKVDGLNYNWDVTATSDGQVVPSGEYLLQVKARKQRTKYQ